MTDEKITRQDLLVVQDPMATTETTAEGTNTISAASDKASPNFRNRLIEKMDHVITKKGANFIGKRGGAKEEGGTVNTDAMSEDVKRALDALKTNEAKEAFKGGGGGKVAEMEMKKANDDSNNNNSNGLPSPEDLALSKLLGHVKTHVEKHVKTRVKHNVKTHVEKHVKTRVKKYVKHVWKST